MAQPTDDVSLFDPVNGLLCDRSNLPFPSTLFGWSNDSICTGPLELGPDGTHYGFVESGIATLRCGGRSHQLTHGMYFSVPGQCQLEGTGNGFVATRIGYEGLFQLGGPIEATGRLRYIDGCSDTLLISPPVKGDPCLNLLHLPPHTRQTAHTHPTVRFGMIVAGSGICRTATRELELERGMIFSIAPDGLHSFNTNDRSLLVIAWHPDSDCGPTHQDHPMINRTIIEGVSAAERLRRADESFSPADSNR
ncbi:MAG: AraC family ligand binding domain-containing protein [Planctomycetales bacterium]|nr:AraC family ligand binding domain-containing protein [Planctomycetales bacterium]